MTDTGRYPRVLSSQGYSKREMNRLSSRRIFEYRKNEEEEKNERDTTPLRFFFFFFFFSRVSLMD